MGAILGAYGLSTKHFSLDNIDSLVKNFVDKK